MEWVYTLRIVSGPGLHRSPILVQPVSGCVMGCTEQLLLGGQSRVGGKNDIQVLQSFGGPGGAFLVVLFVVD